MNRPQCQQLIDSYLDWLRAGLSVQELQGGCELTTPFLDRHNDHIQIYAVRKNGTIVLSDDGYILSDLRTSGLDVSSPKRKLVLETVLNGFGVKSQGTELFIEASERTLGQRLNSLVQAMLAVNDMFVMAKPRVASFFWEDVREFLDRYEVRYSPRVKIPGRSGYDHLIDFLIPKSKNRPERLVQVINSPAKNMIANYLWTLSDTRDARGQESETYAFLNDQEQSVGGDVIEALQAYNVIPALWSSRDSYAERLAS